ncbi:hypothetical protein Plhal304r1_c060g0145941 [Plasmopara halstedii]
METAAPSCSVQQLQNVLTQIQTLCTKAFEKGTSSKHQQIRVMHWVQKLRNQPTSNPTWLKNVLEYANLLLQMIVNGVFEEPFTKMPSQGPLAALPRHQVARLHVKAAKRTSRAQSAHSSYRRNESKSEIEQPLNNNRDDKVHRGTMVSKEIQTLEQDNQWEWQHVWKGAFDEMRQQLQLKTETVETLTTENKELRALVAGYQKAQEEIERNQRDAMSRHNAEIENLRAVHSLELSDVKARHRQKLQEVMLQNEEKLRRRRLKDVGFRPTDSNNYSSRDANANANAAFLQYIDDFYSSTLHLTAQNKV